MTQVATPAAVVAPFPSRIMHEGAVYELVRDGDEYFVDVAGDAGKTRTPIVLTTGSHHMQVYWLSTGQSRELKPLPVVWLIDEQRWTPRNAVFLRPPHADRGAEIGRWNRTCIKCHTTLGQPRYETMRKMDTRVAEFGIACEACHGPGAQHVDDELAQSITQPQYLAHRRASEVCGQCHSITIFADEQQGERWNAAGHAYRPGGELAEVLHVVRGGDAANDPKTAALLANRPYFLEDRFWPDGMVRVSGREYNGLIESPCYQRGEMTCMSCHQMHKPASDPRELEAWANDQLKLGMDGDQACLQCHESFAKDIEAHTHHAPASSGSRCMNCHMPHTTYGLLKAIRSHTVSSPSVRESTEHGRPNACNQCHLDKSLGWTASQMSAWYDQTAPPLSEDQANVSATALWLMQGDAGQRALAAWTCDWPSAKQTGDTSWLKPYLVQLLIDPYDAVRFIAYRALGRPPGYDYMAPPEERRQFARRAMSELTPSPETIDLMMRMLQQRDDRLIGLQE